LDLARGLGAEIRTGERRGPRACGDHERVGVEGGAVGSHTDAAGGLGPAEDALDLARGLGAEIRTGERVLGWS
ncbi:MAG: hypothetical protein ACKOGJ_07420, partial [Phycisphaerales bacterium]